MRFTPQLRELNWLVARPIAHRGLHNGKTVIENTPAAFGAAIAADFAIECDLQISADGEAMVFHDDDVDRLMDAKGSVKSFDAKQLQKMKFAQTADRMQTLGELLEQVDGKSTLVIELKSHWDGNMDLVRRSLEVLESYDGPVAVMSFDPQMIACACTLAPHLVRGITADRTTDPYYEVVPVGKRVAMRSFAHLDKTQPHFVSYNWQELPFDPITEIRNAGHPVITWTTRSKAEAAKSLRYCDQVTFEGYVP
jgi:glycerophosphoryl diester phosphodiesterase